MDKTEVAKLVYVVMNTYPSIYKNYDKEATETMVSTWTSILKDIKYDVAAYGLKMFIRDDKKGFPPTPGQIIDVAEEARKRFELAKLLIAMGQSDEDVFYNTGLHTNQVTRNGIEVHN